MADQLTAAEARDEVDRLRGLLEKNGINPDEAVVENPGVVGNLADLQRLGALALSTQKTNVEDAVVMPAQIDEDTGETIPAETASGYLVEEPQEA